MDFMDLLPKGTKWIGRSAMSLFIVQARYTGIHHTVLSILQTYLKQMYEISCKKKKKSGDGCQPTSSFSGKLSALFSYFIFSIWVLIASVTLSKYFTSTNLTAFSKMRATLRPGLRTPLVLRSLG